MKANPEFCIYTNFDPNTGRLLFSDWRTYECIIVHVSEDEQPQEGYLEDSLDRTSVYIDKAMQAEFQGRLKQELRTFDVSYFLLSLTVKNERAWFMNAHQYFISKIKDYLSEEDYLEWMKHGDRKELLASRCWQSALDSGLFNIILPLIDAPYMKNILKQGVLPDSGAGSIIKAKKIPLSFR